MTDPTVVMGFLDVAGTFDPTLAFVLGGAVATTFVAFRWVLRQPKPRLDDAFHLLRTRTLDSRLLAGSVIFGIGWGLAGYCPDPALAFTIAMLAGALVGAAFVQKRWRGRLAWQANKTIMPVRGIHPKGLRQKRQKAA